LNVRNREAGGNVNTVRRVLFYPTLVYSAWEWNANRLSGRDGERNEEAQAGLGENTPLLRE